MHMLLLGIVACLVVYMYLVCRDFKRVEAEVVQLKNKVEWLQKLPAPPQTSVVHIQQQPPATCNPQPAKPVSAAGMNPTEITVNPPPHADDDDGDDDDAMSEDLREMLTRIEEDDQAKLGAGEDEAEQEVEEEEAVAAAPATNTLEFYQTKKMDELRGLLRDRKLDTKGKRDDLIARLVQSTA